MMSNNVQVFMNGKRIEFPDVLIAATFSIIKGDYLLTFNKDHFKRIPILIEKVLDPSELKELI